MAFKTVEVAVDLKDTSQQIRVLQGKEQRSFFRLFAHKYIVHLGNYDARLFKDAMAASTPMVDMQTSDNSTDALPMQYSPVSSPSPSSMLGDQQLRIYDVRYVHSGETEEQESIHAVQCLNYYTLHAHHAAIIVAAPCIYLWIGISIDILLIYFARQICSCIVCHALWAIACQIWTIVCWICRATDGTTRSRK